MSILTASQRTDINSLILFYPAFILEDEMRSRFPSATAIPEQFQLMGMTLSRDYAQVAREIDLMNEATRFDGPVIIFHGTADSIVPLSYSQEAIQHFPNAQLVTFDGTGHSFSGQTEKEVISRTVDFLNSAN